jgi:glyoxylase-like metal-dependent hydrolase (beta-lactamase superfamily II)
MRDAEPYEVSEKIYLVGSSEITDTRDCSVYLLDLGELVLIDAGAGPSAFSIIRNIERVGRDPSRLSAVLVTHCHVDHSGGARFFQQECGARIIMHEQDAGAVERGDSIMTAAHWYNLHFEPTRIDVKVHGEQESFSFGEHSLVCLHTPGHTPGSLSVYLDLEGKRVLFGQDIHGPFHPDFGSDLAAWRASMERLLALDADVLCEGHFGVYEPKERVASYIRHYIAAYAEED